MPSPIVGTPRPIGRQARPVSETAPCGCAIRPKCTCPDTGSIASYKDPGVVVATGTTPTFETTHYFQRALCQHLVELFRNDYSVTNSDVPPVDFTWFASQDYHYYNYKPAHQPGLIIRLAAEIKALHDTMLPTALGGVDVVGAAGHDVTISVCETGAAADTANIRAAEYPYTAAVMTAAEADRFQARDLWRRLAVAATQARYVAWHSHMASVEMTAGLSAGFLYTGLRYDVPFESNYDPNTVNERPSYYAYQRFTSLAATDAPYNWQIIARFTNPLPTPMIDYFHTGTSTLLPEDIAIAIHFVKGRDLHWYLLMIDPSADLGAFGATRVLPAHFPRPSTTQHTYAVATLAPLPLLGTHLGTADLEVWASVPGPSPFDPALRYNPGDGATFPTQLPDASWTAATAAPRAVSSHEVRFSGPDTDPVLISSNRPLSVVWSWQLY